MVKCAKHALVHLEGQIEDAFKAETRGGGMATKQHLISAFNKAQCYTLQQKAV